MVQVIDQQGSIFGRIGKGIGQGLADQLPKEMDRIRLSSGLRGLENSKETSPLAQLSEVYSIPGITPEIANQALEYRRQQGIIQEAQNKNPGQDYQQQQQPQQTARNQVQKEPQIDKSRPVSSQRQEEQEPIVRRKNTPESWTQRGLELHQQSPLRYRTLEQGIAQAQQEYVNEQANIEQVNSDFNNILAEKLHKGGSESYGDVLGDLQQSFRKEAEDAVISGKMSPKEAVRHYTGEALEFAKSRQKLKEVGSLSWLSGTREGKKDSLSEIRKEYAKHDRLDEYKNDLISYEGMSDAAASRFAYPLSPEAKEVVNKSTSIASKLKSSFSYDGIADKIGSSIKDKDSILGIAYELDKNGINGDQFMSSLQKEYNAGKFKLNARQAKELQASRNFRSTINDVYYFSLGGMK